ncbi:hypothetical protein AJ87_16380 [Rhizobium yanglingense]|nr:hypothetical protein AJ87_16380 [Rhizobium yanglingense]
MAEAARAKYKVGGMDCASCAAKIDTAVRRIAGVEEVSVSVTAGTMTISHDGTSDLNAIEKKVTGLGYSVVAMPAKAPDHDHAAQGHSHGHTDHDHHGHTHSEKDITGVPGHDHGQMGGLWWQSRKGRLTIAAGAALAAAYVAGHLMPRSPPTPLLPPC